MTKKQITEYLAKYNIANKEQFSLHIEQLKRNTSPNVRLINELEWVKEDTYFTTTSTPVSQFFCGQIIPEAFREEKETVKNIFATNVQEALQTAEEHQAQFGRVKGYEADRFSETVDDYTINWKNIKKPIEDLNSGKSDDFLLDECGQFPFFKYQTDDWKNTPKTENKIRQKKVKTVLDDTLKDCTIFNNNRAEKDTMEFLKAGIKETDGKLDYSEINLEILDLMSERFTANKHKYPQGNMKRPMDIKKLEWALFRHVKKMVQPIQNDEETYEQHLASALCNLSMILDQLKLNKS